MVTYEELTRDCFTTMRGVLRFLDRDDITDASLQQVVDNAQFDKMKKRDLNYVPGCPSFLARASLREEGKHFLRKGKVGAWKLSLTVSQSEQVDRYIGESLLKKLRI